MAAPTGGLDAPCGSVCCARLLRKKRSRRGALDSNLHSFSTLLPRVWRALPSLVLQLRGIDKKIAALKAELNYAATGDRQQYVSGIICLEEEKSKLARGAMLASHGQGDLSDTERPECRSSTDEKDEKEDDDDELTPPPSAKLQSVDTDDEDCSEVPSMSTHSQPASGISDGGVPGSAVICERELRQHFHLPLHTAAQKFGICTTAFKKLCRRFGIAKWPHRQLRGIDKKIAALKAELNYTTGDREGCCRSLKALREEKMRISRSSASRGADKSLEEAGSDGSSPSSSPILVAADHSNRMNSSGNDSLWHGGRCLTDDSGISCFARDQASKQEQTPATEELECAAALSMLAQLAGMTQERDRAAAVAGVARTRGLGEPPRESILGKRSFEGQTQVQGMQGSRTSSAAASDADTPPLEPRLPDLASSSAPPLDPRACNSSSRLPPIVPSVVPSSVASH
jgi:hypothetical protein